MDPICWWVDDEVFCIPRGLDGQRLVAQAVDWDNRKILRVGVSSEKRNYIFYCYETFVEVPGRPDHFEFTAMAKGLTCNDDIYQLHHSLCGATPDDPSAIRPHAPQRPGAEAVTTDDSTVHVASDRDHSATNNATTTANNDENTHGTAAANGNNANPNNKHDTTSNGNGDIGRAIASDAQNGSAQRCCLDGPSRSHDPDGFGAEAASSSSSRSSSPNYSPDYETPADPHSHSWDVQVLSCPFFHPHKVSVYLPKGQPLAPPAPGTGLQYIIFTPSYRRAAVALLDYGLPPDFKYLQILVVRPAELAVYLSRFQVEVPSPFGRHEV